MRVMSQSPGWKERMGGANSSHRAPKSREIIWLLYDGSQTEALPPVCHTSPCMARTSLALSRILRNSSYSPSSPLVPLKKKQALYCLLLAACISQDEFHTKKCHLLAIPDQQKKYSAGCRHMAFCLPAELSFFYWACHGDIWGLHCKGLCKDLHVNDKSSSLEIQCMWWAAWLQSPPPTVVAKRRQKRIKSNVAAGISLAIIEAGVWLYPNHWPVYHETTGSQYRSD